MSTKPWTHKERATLAAYYPIEGKNVMKRLPGRSWPAVHCKADEIGLKSKTPAVSRRTWSEAEETILREVYPRGGLEAAQRALPSKSVKAIRGKIDTLPDLHFIGAASLLGFDEAEALRRLNKLGSGTTLFQLCEAMDRPPSVVRDLLRRLKEAHHTIELKGDETITVHDKPPMSKKLGLFDVESYFGSSREITFGVASDLHYNNIHAREELVDFVYRDIFKPRGVAVVFNPGNMIDGEIWFNRHEIINTGIERQVRYFAEKVPRVDGITTYFVTGDDHEGWFAKQLQIDIGAFIQEKMEKAGRSDWKYLCHMEADIAFKTQAGECVVRVSHPGGGTAYALSYSTQKTVESIEGGEKPHVLIEGHYHKTIYMNIRNVHCLLAGTLQDQTSFMRKKKIAAHIGAWIVHMTLGKDGAVLRFHTEWFPFFDKKVYAINNKYDIGQSGRAKRGHEPILTL